MNIKRLFARGAMVIPVIASIMAYTPSVARANITINYGQGTTTYAFVNVSGATATVVAQYYNPDGSTQLTHTYSNVAPNTRTNVVLGGPDAMVPSQWKGSLVLSSDQDIIAVASTEYTGKGSPGNGYGAESVLYAAFNSGSTTLYVPQLLRTSGVNLSTSRLTIQNTTANATVANVTYYYGGAVVGPRAYPLNAFGSVTIDTAVDADVAPANWSGTASAVVTSAQPVVGFAERHWDVITQQQNWAAGYALLTPAQAGTKLLAPAAFRNCVGGACVLTVASSFNTYSTYLVQNTTGNNAQITIKIINRATGLPLANQMVRTLGPFASFIWNPFNNNNNPGAPLEPQFAEMGGNFNGSAEITSNQPIVAVGYTMNPIATTVQNTAGGYQFMTAADASSTVWAPRFARVCTNCNNFNNIVDFTQFGNLQIMNVGNSAVTLSSIQFLNPNGTVKFTLNGANQATYFLPGQSLTIQPGASIAINTRVGGSLDRGGGGGATAPKLDTIFGNSFNGSVRVNAPGGALIKAIVTVSKAEKYSDIYNALNR